jgi:hypothetical protein
MRWWSTRAYVESEIKHENIAKNNFLKRVSDESFFNEISHVLLLAIYNLSKNRYRVWVANQIAAFAIVYQCNSTKSVYIVKLYNIIQMIEIIILKWWTLNIIFFRRREVIETNGIINIHRHCIPCLRVRYENVSACVTYYISQFNIIVDLNRDAFSCIVDSKSSN